MSKLARILTLAILGLFGLQAAALIVPRDGWPHHRLPGQAVQAEATGACGIWQDSNDYVYGPRGYQSKAITTWDNAAYQYVTVNVDLEYFNVTHNGHCFTGYRMSEWGPYSNTPGYYGYLRVWVCGHQMPDVSSVTWVAGTGGQLLSNPYDGYRDVRYYQVDGGTMAFYDNSGCGYQADNWWSAAKSQFWDQYAYAEAPGGVASNWYLKY